MMMMQNGADADDADDDDEVMRHRGRKREFAGDGGFSLKDVRCPRDLREGSRALVATKAYDVIIF